MEYDAALQTRPFGSRLLIFVDFKNIAKANQWKSNNPKGTTLLIFCGTPSEFQSIHPSIKPHTKLWKRLPPPGLLPEWHSLEQGILPEALAVRMGMRCEGPISQQEKRDMWDIVAILIGATSTSIRTQLMYWSVMYLTHPWSILYISSGNDESSPLLSGWKQMEMKVGPMNGIKLIPRRVFYMFNVDHYDTPDLKSPILIEISRRGWDIVYFTDVEAIGSVNAHSFVRVQPLHLRFNGDTRRSYKFVKIKPYSDLGNYAVSWYMDSNIRMNDDFLKSVETGLREGHRFLTTQHHSNCVYKESEVIVRNDLEEFLIEARQKQRFRLHDRLPENYGLLTSAVLIRWMYNPRVQLFNEIWMQEVMNSSRRDQAAFMVAHWRLNNILHLPAPISISLPFSMIAHNRLPHRKRSKLVGEVEGSLRFVHISTRPILPEMQKFLSGMNEWLLDNMNCIFYVSAAVPVRLWPYVGEQLCSSLVSFPTLQIHLLYMKSSGTPWGRVELSFVHRAGLYFPRHNVLVTVNQ